MYISRCGKGFGALKDQGTTNQIVYRFIADYNTLFLDPGEDPPAVYWVSIFLVMKNWHIYLIWVSPFDIGSFHV